MSALDEFKDEAERLWLSNPLNVCDVLARKVNGTGWSFTEFHCDIRLFGSVEWTVKSRFTSSRTRVTHKQAWHELEALLKGYGLEATQYKIVDHRKYETVDGYRTCVGREWEFYIEFKPAVPLNVSVLGDYD